MNVHYYKIIHKETETIMCYMSCKDEVGVNEILELMGKEYFYEEIEEEEFTNNASKVEGMK